MSLLDNAEYVSDLRGDRSSRSLASKWGVTKTKINDDRHRIGATRFVPANRTGDSGKRFVESTDGSFEATIPHDKEFTLRDAEEWVRKAGKDPSQFIITVDSRAYGDGMWSNGVKARPKNPEADHVRLSEEERAYLLKRASKTIPIASDGPSRNFAAVLNLADLQIGKAGEKGGGTPETLERVRNAISKFTAHLSRTDAPVAVLVDNGDSIENICSTPKQAFTNDLDVPAQIRVVRRLFLEAIKAVRHVTPKVIFVSVPSNHGEFRVAGKAQAGTTEADFGLEIHEQLKDICVESETLRDVEFVRPEPLELVAEVTVARTKLAFTHGHLSSGPTGHARWWAHQDHGRLPGWDADILVTAHYHSLRVEQSGDGRWIIGVSSADPGSKWYTSKTGESALAGLTAFDVYGGQWHDLRIL